MFKKWVKTAPAGTEEELTSIKLAELQKKFNALLVKLDADHAAATDHKATLKVEEMEKSLINSPNKQGV